jgi:hypothetical protein
MSRINGLIAWHSLSPQILVDTIPVGFWLEVGQQSVRSGEWQTPIRVRYVAQSKYALDSLLQDVTRARKIASDTPFSIKNWSPMA